MCQLPLDRSQDRHLQREGRSPRHRLRAGRLLLVAQEALGGSRTSHEATQGCSPSIHAGANWNGSDWLLGCRGGRTGVPSRWMHEPSSDHGRPHTQVVRDGEVLRAHGRANPDGDGKARRKRSRLPPLHQQPRVRNGPEAREARAPGTPCSDGGKARSITRQGRVSPSHQRGPGRQRPRQSRTMGQASPCWRAGARVGLSSLRRVVLIEEWRSPSGSGSRV